MKKINIFLIILIFVLGSFILYRQLFLKPTQTENIPTPIQNVENNSNNTNNSTENKSVVGFNQTTNKISIPEEELKNQIQNKKYLESTYMALEYSKVNNMQLIDTIKGYLDNNSKMKPEDVDKLISIHEKTFLNRYLKIFVMNPTSDLNNLNSRMKQIFYQTKTGFDTLSNYSKKPVTSTPTDSNTETITPTSAKNNEEIVYSMENLQSGVVQLEQAQLLINDALEELGKIDIEIERKWIEAGLSEEDILNIIDKSNGLEIIEEPSNN